jgi:hypothetical protein
LVQHHILIKIGSTSLTDNRFNITDIISSSYLSYKAMVQRYISFQVTTQLILSLLGVSFLGGVVFTT